MSEKSLLGCNVSIIIHNNTEKITRESLQNNKIVGKWLYNDIYFFLIKRRILSVDGVKLNLKEIIKDV